MVERTLVERLAVDLDLPAASVEGAVALLAESATVPFIARYRKERTGALREEHLWEIAAALRQLRSLEQRKAKVLAELEAQGTLTDAVRGQIAACLGLTELEDLHQWHRGKRRSRGHLARERGLEPLAQAILAQTPGSPPLEEVAAPYVAADRGVPDPAAALEGAAHIISEAVADDPAVRNRLRELFIESGAVRARVAEGRGKRPSKYEMYYDFSEPLTKIPPHRVLAVRRGEKEGWLRVSIESDRKRALEILREGRVTAPETPAATVVETALADAYDRLLSPVLEAEFRAELKRRADAEAIHVFARNVRSLLLQPPAGPRRTLGVYPSPRHPCAFAVVDEEGKLLEALSGVRIAERGPAKPPAPPAPPAAPTPPASETPAEAPAEAPPPLDASAEAPQPEAPAPPAPEASAPMPPPAAPAEAPAPPAAPAEAPLPAASPDAKAQVRALIEKHQVAAIAIGSGSVSHEAEQFMRDLLKGMPDRRFLRVSVSEAGASVYATSRAARDEFPDLDPSARAAVSIARRLQDPLTELAQVDPKAIGVGQYQHDVNQHALHESLRSVVESCVNLVGVDVNRAPAALLAHVAGVGRATAREIVRYRVEHGPLRSRAQLAEVPHFGEKQLEQAAGFLRVFGGEQPLDATPIHPERYELVARIAADAGTTPAALLGSRERIEAIDFARYAGGDVSEPTLADLRRYLAHPSHDPRGAFRSVECHENVASLEDLKPGMILEGTVTNVTNFGAFVDIGLPEDGLVHVSHLARRYVKDPNQVVALGRVVRVKVLVVDLERRRIALSMKDAVPPPPKRPPRPKRPKPAEEKKPEEKRQEKGQEPRRAAPAPARPPQEQKPKRDPFAKATPEDIARLIAHFQGR